MVGHRTVAEGSASAHPEWWQLFLDALATAADTGNLSALKIDARTRLKEEWVEIRDALTAADAIAPGVDVWERHLSEALFADSKRLSRIRPRVAQLLRSADPRWLDVPAGEGTESMNILIQYGIRRRPPTLTLAGSLRVRLGGDEPAEVGGARSYELADFAPVATLPALWAGALAAGAAASGIVTVTTVENEYPFLAYVDECGGPEGLGRQRELVVYVGGFPSTATLVLLAGLVSQRPPLEFRHWGDADAGGLSIWWFLRQRLGCPVHLFRTTAAWVTEAASREGQRLSESERSTLRNHVARFEDALAIEQNASDLRQALELGQTLLRLDMKLEQERI
jgi:hypothetical protein